MKCKLGEIVDVIMGQSPKSEFYNTEEKGYPFLQGNRTFGLKYPTFDIYTTVLTKLAKAGDIIMSVRAPVGDLNITPVDMCLGRGVCSLRMKNGNQSYLFYMMKYYIPYLRQKESGTVFGSVSKGDITALEVDIIEDVEKQKKIARYLEMIDDKIELNNAINNNLEHQAQAIFKNSFVDFSPFDGIQPHSWTISSLGAITNMVAGGDKPKVISTIQTEACPYPIYANGLRENGLYGYTNTPKICDESVTVSARGTVGFVCIRHTPYVPIVRLVALIPNIELVSVKYLYLYLKQLNITGTGTTQQQLTIPDFKKTPILIPDKETMSKFTNVITPLFLKIWANEKENSKLLALRDTLLPQLMSGKLEVSEINI